MTSGVRRVVGRIISGVFGRITSIAPVSALRIRLPRFNAAVWNVQYQLRMWNYLDSGTSEDLMLLLETYTASPRILDLGCGTSINLQLTAGRYRHYHGVDISMNAIQTARKHARPNASFEVADVLRYQTAERYDAILLRDVLSCLPQQEIAEFLRHIAGFLNSDGKIFIRCWDKSACAEVIRIIFDSGFRVLEEQVARAKGGPESSIIVLQGLS
jgi:2-polyprenyl-3-methyl-5-hydroxy-6-metoxy-1,4-benzoquinol methylase